MEIIQDFQKKLGFVIDSFFDAITVYSFHFLKMNLLPDQKDEPTNCNIL